MNPLESRSHDELIQKIREILQESEDISNRMMTITNIGIEMSHATDFDSILNIVTKNVKWLIDCDHCSLLVINPYGQWQSRTILDKYEKEYELQINNSVIQEVMNNGKSKIMNDSTPDFLSPYPHKLVIPLTRETELMGTIHFAGDSPFDHEDLRIGLFLAFQLASTISNIIRMQVLLTTQQQLSDYAKELTVQNEEIETYNYTIAHDLKSPLNIIPLKIDLIKMNEPDLKPDTIQHLADLTNRVEHMGDMIDQLLILSKLRDNTETLQRIDPNSVIERCLMRFPDVESGMIKVEVQPDLPRVIGHAQWLEEVFANLISNAIKYMGSENTEPTIKISAEFSDNQAKFMVQDNGIGIHQHDQQKLFREFARLKDIQAEGLGLGLSIVHRIVRRFGGKLGVESEWGHGTTFWFTIPVLSIGRFTQPPSG